MYFFIFKYSIYVVDVGDDWPYDMMACCTTPPEGFLTRSLSIDSIQVVLPEGLLSKAEFVTNASCPCTNNKRRFGVLSVGTLPPASMLPSTAPVLHSFLFGRRTPLVRMYCCCCVRLDGQLSGPFRNVASWQYTLPLASILSWTAPVSVLHLLCQIQNTGHIRL